MSGQVSLGSAGDYQADERADVAELSWRGSSVHGFFRQEYWSGLPFPPPGDLSNSGIEPKSPVFPA